MTQLLSYLRRGFESLEQVTKDEFDELLTSIRQQLISSNSDNVEEVSKLTALTAHYYGLAGTKMAQLVSIRASIERQMDNRKVQVSNTDGIPLHKKADLERRLLVDDGYQKLRQELDEVGAMILYFQNMRETLYMNHYHLRKETVNQSTGRYNKINHGDS